MINRADGTNDSAMTDRQKPGSSGEMFAFSPARRHDLAFEIAAIDAYHLVEGAETYWQDYKPQDRVATDRFLLKPGWRTVYGKRFETALIRVTLSDGSTGWGEATEPICPEAIGSLAVRLLGVADRCLTELIIRHLVCHIGPHEDASITDGVSDNIRAQNDTVLVEVNAFDGGESLCVGWPI